MGIFARQKAAEILEERLRKVEVSCDSLERATRGLHLEWEELYDKVRRQMARMSKRAAVDAREAGNGFDEAPPEVDPEEPDPISAAIKQRRGLRSPTR